jgi:deoxyribonuclease II
MSKLQFALLFCQLLSTAFAIADRLGCRDESGNMVDWFYLYKLPNEFDRKAETVEQSNSGLNYLFITASSDRWTLSQRLINESNSMPGLTLSPAYHKNNDNFVMMYNDEPPNGATDGSRGHTKGVVVANDISGFWLIHSVPKYPPALEEGRYDYPHTGTIYGQSFLCISFTGDQMGTVGKQLAFNEPHFYSSHVPEYLKT